MRNKMVGGEEATGSCAPGLEEGMRRSKSDSHRVTGTESDSWSGERESKANFTA